MTKLIDVVYINIGQALDYEVSGEAKTLREELAERARNMIEVPEEAIDRWFADVVVINKQGQFEVSIYDEEE